MNDLQARKAALQAIVKHESFPFQTENPVFCRNVPAGMGDGTGFIHQAIEEINAMIASIVHRSLVDRSF